MSNRDDKLETALIMCQRPTHTIEEFKDQLEMAWFTLREALYDDDGDQVTTAMIVVLMRACEMFRDDQYDKADLLFEVNELLMDMEVPDGS